MLLLGLRNTTAQDLVEGSLLTFGEVYRRFDRRGNCGCRAFELNGTSVALGQPGIYHLTAVITFTGDAAGDAIFQLAENGILIPGAVTTETVTTATTQTITTVLDYYILVDNNIVLNSLSALKNVSIVNTGIDTTVTNLVVNIDKVI